MYDRSTEDLSNGRSLSKTPWDSTAFEFVEFASPDPGVLENAFTLLGFTEVAQHRSKDVTLWRQGDINFIINNEPKSQAWYFAREHGPCACGMAFRVKDAHKAYNRALEQGAQPVEIPTGPMEIRLPAIKGIGGATVYLIDRYEDGTSIYDIDFNFIEGVDRHPEGCGFDVIDHLTHNVYRGRMEYWADYYEKLFNFREIRYFDIKGEYTGLLSKAMTAPDGKIRIPLNEEASKGTGQIEEYLMEFNGEGIQHIAFSCDDLYACWDRLQKNGIEFMTAPPDAYYEMLEERLPGHGEPSMNCSRAASCSTARQTAMSRACCCRFFRRTWSARRSSSSSSARKTKALAKATSRRCSNRSSATRSRAASSAPTPDRSKSWN